MATAAAAAAIFPCPRPSSRACTMGRCAFLRARRCRWPSPPRPPLPSTSAGGAVWTAVANRRRVGGGARRRHVGGGGTTVGTGGRLTGRLRRRHRVTLQWPPGRLRMAPGGGDGGEAAAPPPPPCRSPMTTPTRYVATSTCCRGPPSGACSPPSSGRPGCSSECGSTAAAPPRRCLVDWRGAPALGGGSVATATAAPTPVAAAAVATARFAVGGRLRPVAGAANRRPQAPAAVRLRK